MTPEQIEKLKRENERYQQAMTSCDYTEAVAARSAIHEIIGYEPWKHILYEAQRAEKLEAWIRCLRNTQKSCNVAGGSMAGLIKTVADRLQYESEWDAETDRICRGE
jgi:hypothetical protein